MFKNLDAEQARHSYTNQRMADMVGISRVSYENKKKNWEIHCTRSEENVQDIQGEI